MSAVEVEQLPVSLELGCSEDCREFAGRVYLQLAHGNYDRMSVARLPQDIKQWRGEHRTARKRADRCERLGYRFVPVLRHERADDIFLINTSLGTRQHRPMAESYYRRPPVTPDQEYPCSRHGIHPFGVESDNGLLVAYLWLYRAGQLALVSQILGHGGYLPHGIMYLLWQGMLAAELREPGYVIYNRHDSGTNGLRFYKERVGLAETQVRWCP